MVEVSEKVNKLLSNFLKTDCGHVLQCRFDTNLPSNEMFLIKLWFYVDPEMCPVARSTELNSIYLQDDNFQTNNIELVVRHINYKSKEYNYDYTKPLIDSLEKWFYYHE